MINIENLLIKNTKIVIAPTELRSYFLDLKNDNPTLNFKFFTPNELIINLRGNYLDERVIKIGFKIYNGYSFSLIKEISQYIFNSNNIENEKDAKIVEFYNEIKRNNLIKEDNDFLYLLKNRELIFINYKDSNFINSFIQKYNLTNFKHYEINDFVEVENKKTYHEFFNIGDELKYGLNVLFDELNKTKDPSKYYIYLDTTRFEYYMNLFLSNVNVPINFESNLRLINSKAFHIFESLLTSPNDNYLLTLITNKDKFNEDIENYQMILDVVRSFEVDTLNNKEKNLKEILSNILLKTPKYKNAITISDKLKFYKNKDIYIFGLDSSFLPKAKKDNGYFDKGKLHEAGLDNLDDMNLISYNIENAFLKLPSVKYISYHYKDNSGKYNKSYYIESLKMTKLPNTILEKEYLRSLTKVYYENYYDGLSKGNKVTDEFLAYRKLFNNEIPVLYDPSFKGINNYEYQNKSYSYSALSDYSDCPFKYYVNKILKAPINEEIIELDLGNIAHSIFEHIYDLDFDFDKELNNALNKVYADKEMPPRTEVILHRFIDELRVSANYKREHIFKYMKSPKNYSEKGLTVSSKELMVDFINENGEITQKDIPFSYSFYGRIDSILEINENELYLIDYKTGPVEFSKKNVIEKETNLQLPSYYYLINNNDDHLFKDKVVEGMFIQPLIIKPKEVYNFYKRKDEDFKELRLTGCFMNDLEVMSNLDYTLLDEETKESTFIDDVKKNKKGDTLKKSVSKSLEKDTLPQFEKSVKNNLHTCVNKIYLAKYEIEPSDDACTYCKNKDICMKKIKSQGF